MNRLIGFCRKIGAHGLLLLAKLLELFLLDSSNSLECLRIQWVLLLQPDRVKQRLELVRFSRLSDKSLLLLRILRELVVVLLLM